MALINSSKSKLRQEKGTMFGMNHTRNYHTLLVWMKFLIKKILKSPLTPMIFFLALEYVSLMNKGENCGQGRQACEVK